MDIAIIPARSGSKRLKNKNIKLFNKKHIIHYSIKAALKSKLFKKVIVSTDCKKISAIAKKYGAVCTPDFFGYNNNLELQYRGRIKELKNLKPVSAGSSDLRKAMKMVANTGKGPEEQIPSMGCSIKWFK